MAIGCGVFEDEVVGEVIDPSWMQKAPPLDVLAYQLLVGPPSIGHLKQVLQGAEYLEDFLKLVRQYLPEHEREIMAGGPDIGVFARYFEERYFPLNVDGFDGYDDDDVMAGFTSHIPIVLGGLESDEYEELNHWKDGYKLAFALIESPYAELGRVALLESVAGIVGNSLVERIPENGFTQEALKVLEGTKYDGLVKFAAWVNHETGSVFLDSDYENEYPLDWSEDIVRDLTEQWAIAEVYEKGRGDIATWLEEKPMKHMREILDFIQDTPSIPKEQLRFPGEDFNDTED